MQIPPAARTHGFIALGVIAVFLAGMMTAQQWIARRIASGQVFTLEPDTRPKVCTVVIDGIRDGAIEGTLAGSGRVFFGDVQAFPAKGGEFRVPADSFLTQKVTVTIPPGTQFVASKKGSKYYPLQSASAQKIVPQNRAYFRLRAEAEAAGYHP